MDRGWGWMSGWASGSGVVGTRRRCGPAAVEGPTPTGLRSGPGARGWAVTGMEVPHARGVVPAGTDAISVTVAGWVPDGHDAPVRAASRRPADPGRPGADVLVRTLRHALDHAVVRVRHVCVG
ncbi:hypothetical protein GCM10012276_19740 [Nocardioides deserti]|nr:hypothetical protein GCM10012276_19740 [Nocardioides deserti]